MIATRITSSHVAPRTSVRPQDQLDPAPRVVHPWRALGRHAVSGTVRVAKYAMSHSRGPGEQKSKSIAPTIAAVGEGEVVGREVVVADHLDRGLDRRLPHRPVDVEKPTLAS